jgi:hypothetical protein
MRRTRTMNDVASLMLQNNDAKLGQMPTPSQRDEPNPYGRVQF